GTATELTGDGGHRVDQLMVYPGATCPVQADDYRQNHMVVAGGRAILTIDGTRHELKTGASIFIPCLSAVTVENPGKRSLTLIYTQVGITDTESDNR
ncbi:MAG: cupin domain-containing protein, partial [Desulfobacterales bacterium]